MTITREEAEKIMARPEYTNRVAVYVYEDGDEFVTEWEGVEYRAGNMFGLDNKLYEAGVPRPRNLFLLEATK